MDHTDHIASSPSLLHKINISSHSYVGLSIVKKAQVASIGFTKLDHEIILSDVLCVSLFYVNLLSISKMTKNG